MKINKEAKNYLLNILNIWDYFTARKYIKENGTAPYINENTRLDGMFSWYNTKQGNLYWSTLHQRTEAITNGWFENIVKKIIRWFPFLLLLITLQSCQKEREQPQPKTQKVFYYVECSDCLITLESDKWNARNELERSKNQYFNVTGKFKYQFENTTGLDSVRFSIFVTALSGESQTIIARAYTDDGHIAELSWVYGFDPVKDYPYQRTTVLHLK